MQKINEDVYWTDTIESDSEIDAKNHRHICTLNLPLFQERSDEELESKLRRLIDTAKEEPPLAGSGYLLTTRQFRKLVQQVLPGSETADRAKLQYLIENSRVVNVNSDAIVFVPLKERSHKDFYEQ